MQRLKISGKLQLAFAVLICAFLVSSGIVYRSIGKIDAAADSSDLNLARSGEAESLLTLILEQTNALRGYVVRADGKFLKTYLESKVTFDKALSHIKADSSNAAERAQAEQMSAAMARWRAKVGDQVVSLMARPETRSAAADLAGGKSLTELRAVEKQIRASADADADAARRERAAAVRLAIASLLVGGMSAIAIASVMGWLLARTIARPVSQLTDIMLRLAKGDSEISVPGVERKDELGLMANAVGVFRDAALEKARLEKVAAENQRAAQDMRAATEAEREKTAAQQAFVVSALADGLEKLSAGELVFRLDHEFPEEYEKLRTDFNSALANLQHTVGMIAGNAESICGGAKEISRASDDLARRTEQQAANLEETAAALDQITATVRRTAEGASEARAVVEAARADAELSGDVVRKTTDAMGVIEKSSGEIGQIIGVIDEIAFQTNLLALNAGVEAARAGDSGRGFAVVAQEVRALAQRSAEAARQIKALISASKVQVAAGVSLVDEAGEALRRIARQVMDINSAVSEISASTKEQSAGLQQVNEAINRMDQTTQQNAAMVEQSNAASHTLAREAEEMAAQVSQFKVAAEEDRDWALARRA